MLWQNIIYLPYLKEATLKYVNSLTPQDKESHRDRVSAWIDRWHQEGITGLYDPPRSGRPMIYNDDEVTYLKQALDKQPQQLGLAKADLEQFTGKKSSQGTLTRALKKALATAGNTVENP